MNFLIAKDYLLHTETTILSDFDLFYLHIQLKTFKNIKLNLFIKKAALKKKSIIQVYKKFFLLELKNKTKKGK